MFKSIVEYFAKIRWSINPGCFERHLQRRYQNLLFSKNRRIVSSSEIFEARYKDKKDFQDFVQKFSDYHKRTPDELGTPEEMMQILLKEIDPLIKMGLGVAGEASSMVKLLIKKEKFIFDYVKKFYSSNPEVLKTISTMESLSTTEQNLFFIQSTRKDTPILKEEVIPAFLSEDLDTIKYAGFIARSFPTWEWKDSDVVECLKRGVDEGFNPQKAKTLLDAYREWSDTKVDKTL